MKKLIKSFIVTIGIISFIVILFAWSIFILMCAATAGKVTTGYTWLDILIIVVPFVILIWMSVYHETQPNK